MIATTLMFEVANCWRIEAIGLMYCVSYSVSPAVGGRDLAVGRQRRAVTARQVVDHDLDQGRGGSGALSGRVGELLHQSGATGGAAAAIAAIVSSQMAVWKLATAALGGRAV